MNSIKFLLNSSNRPLNAFMERKILKKKQQNDKEMRRGSGERNEGSMECTKN